MNYRRADQCLTLQKHVMYDGHWYRIIELNKLNKTATLAGWKMGNINDQQTVALKDVKE